MSNLRKISINIDESTYNEITLPEGCKIEFTKDGFGNTIRMNGILTPDIDTMLEGILNFINTNLKVIKEVIVTFDDLKFEFEFSSNSLCTYRVKDRNSSGEGTLGIVETYSYLEIFIPLIK